MRDDPLQLDQFLCFAVYSASHAFNRAYKPILDQIGLTYPQYLAMVVLWQEDGQTVSRIGDKLFLETSTLTPILKRLEAAGHLRRVRDHDDERLVSVRLTKQGQALRKTACQVPVALLRTMGQSPDQLQALHSALTTLRDALSQSDEISGYG